LPRIRSTAIPHHTKISRLKPRWISPEWTNVALSGVSTAGSAGQETATPLSRAGMKPSANPACSDFPSTTAIIHASAVIAAIT